MPRTTISSMNERDHTRREEIRTHRRNEFGGVSTPNTRRSSKLTPCSSSAQTAPRPPVASRVDARRKTILDLMEDTLLSGHMNDNIFEAFYRKAMKNINFLNRKEVDRLSAIKRSYMRGCLGSNPNYNGRNHRCDLCEHRKLHGHSRPREHLKFHEHLKFSEHSQFSKLSKHSKFSKLSKFSKFSKLSKFSNGSNGGDVQRDNVNDGQQRKRPSQAAFFEQTEVLFRRNNVVAIKRMRVESCANVHNYRRRGDYPRE
ncbi:hypothetical protein BGZ65_004262 [Modicella reniformis]|uniref:Uncharacterized protein n=1 Tax=Modicella reniformis TaxID=1440133 RepID=A0A9P6MBG8_9FUNG|nr:hypothetical protein BGZ65_004262 [Modicella reniformis]